MAITNHACVLLYTYCEHTVLNVYQLHVHDCVIYFPPPPLPPPPSPSLLSSPIPPLPFIPLSLSLHTRTGNMFEKQLVSRLRGVMLHEDLEEVTSRQLRQKLEEEMDTQLTEYREFLDRHMLHILGQMEQPSKILDYLYLVGMLVEYVEILKARQRQRKHSKQSANFKEKS